MSVFLRALPAIALRFKPLSLKPPPLFYFNKIHKLLKPNTLLKRGISSASASVSAAGPPSPSTDSLFTLEWVSRTAFCGQLSEIDVGKRVRLCGWVALHRIHGGLSFLNLRDNTGIIQVTTLPDEFPDSHSIVNNLRLEYVIAVEGVVRSRPTDSVNKKMKTGMIEVAAENVQVLNVVNSKLPFLVTTSDDAKDSFKEEIGLSSAWSID